MKKGISIVAVVVAVLVVGCADSQKEQKTAMMDGGQPKVRLTTVHKKAVDQVRDYTCTVEAEVKNNIAPQTMGRISKIYVEVGDHVVKGQKLYTTRRFNGYTMKAK